MFLVLLAGPVLSAQQTDTPTGTPERPYILHVYTNLVQVPALVLDTNFRPLPPLPIDQFNIRLDSGPIFHPTKMHIEGDEPISLGILLDASGAQEKLLTRFAQDFAKVAAQSLLPHDHVTVFAADCKLVRSAQYLGASSADIGQSIENALHAPTLHGGKERGACGRHLHLWDAAAKAMQSLAEQPGRRVLLIVSSGYDHKSVTAWATLDQYASLQSVTVFGLREAANFQGDYGLRNQVNPETGAAFVGGHPEEDAYLELCERNGGYILTTLPHDLPYTLQHIVKLLRGRYIIEFPRPDNSTPGRHEIDITLQNYKAFIATAAVEVSLPNDGRDADPDRVQTSPSPAVMGKRHPLKPAN
jgi:hypothetical protein